MNNNYFDSEEFQEMLRNYEEAINNGESPLLDSDDFTSIAEYYNTKGETEKASEILDHAIDIYPTASAPLIMKARMTLINDEDDVKAQEYLDRVCDKTDLEFNYMQAELWIDQNNEEEAAELLQRVWEENEDEQEDMAIEIATLYVDYDMAEEAAMWLERHDDKESPDYLEVAARIELARRNYDESIRLFNKLIDTNPYSVQYWNMLTFAQVLKGDIRGSIESSEYALAMDNNKTEAIVNKANGLYNLGNFAEAEKYYGRYNRITRGDAQSLLFQASCLFAMNRFQEAAFLLDKAETMADKDMHYLLYDIYQKQAFVQSRMGNLDKALMHINKAYELPVDRNEILVFKGHLLMEHNCVKEAIESFSEALDSSKGSPEIMLKVGMSLYDNNFPKHACKIFEKYLDATDNNIALPYLAACYHDMGDREKYLEYLKEACRLVPQETEIVFDEQFPEGVSPENYYDYEIQNEKQ